MDNKRLIVFMVFFFSVLLLWQKWQIDHNPVEKKVAATSSATSEQQTAAHSEQVSSAPVDNLLQNGKPIHVRTDLMDAEIDTAGGDLRSLSLTKYRESGDPSKPYSFLHVAGGRVYIVQSGLISDGLPTHKTIFTAERYDYEMAPGKDDLSVTLQAPPAAGYRVEKIYTFHRGSYIVDISYRVTNTGSAQMKPYAYFQFVRDGEPPVGAARFAKTYTGAAVYTQNAKFVKEDFSDIEKGKVDYPEKSRDGWIAMIQHHFVSAWLPNGDVSREFYTRKVGSDLYSAGIVVPLGDIEAGKTQQVEMPMFVGPQEQDLLAKTAPGLDLVVDYGWLKILAKPLFWGLSLVHHWVGNWGYAIVIVTLLIKLAFFPLSAASYKSMARMRAVSPKLQKLKEQYGNDTQRANQAMMELYKTEKINPFGGCLPIMIQIPVFIALYTVLLTTVELRNAPFMLWIQDLSQPDPFYVLPLIYGITMILQTRLNPPPPDPMQAKVMQIMPVAFSVIFFFFPAGLVLYSMVNNVLSIAQQWHITRTVGKTIAADAAGK